MFLCWQIADYQIPYKVSSHPVCTYGSDISSRLVLLDNCDSGYPNAYHEVIDALSCTCSTCTGHNTSCQTLNNWHTSCQTLNNWRTTFLTSQPAVKLSTTEAQPFWRHNQLSNSQPLKHNLSDVTTSCQTLNHWSAAFLTSQPAVKL